MTLALPGMEGVVGKASDVVYTPKEVAAAVVRHFRPTGRILDPCKGEGVFADLMPGCDWCEITLGVDFFDWSQPVDWIVSNPPYSIFSDFLRHSMGLAANIVFVMPINKAFNSDRMIKDVWSWGGVKEVLVLGSGGKLGFPIGFAIGAVHFQAGYKGGINLTIPNA